MFEEFMSEEDIISTLKEADDAYYNSASGSSALTDDEYDDLKEYAQKKFPNNEYFKNVGAPIPEKSVKVKHDYILGSLKKVKPEDFPKWYSKYSKNDLYVIMPKLDGASLFVRYDDGVLTRATTRGDGFEGFDITLREEVSS
jgi:DNA ligase (NAD+)